MDDVDTFLEHFGVRGMKWGVRKKARSVDTSVESTAKGRAKSDDAKTAASSLNRSKKQGVGSLSNQELKALNERMNLESSYKQLNAKQKNGARKFAEDIALQLAKETTKEIAKNTIKSGAGAAKEILKARKELPMSAMWGE
jgi:hypothetical protein